MPGLPIPFVDAFLLALLPIAAVLLGVVMAMLRRRHAALVLAHADLKHERDRVRNALEGSSLTIWDWDIAGGSMWLNSNWKEMLGDQPGETQVPVAEIMALVHPEDLERVQKAGTEALKGIAGEFDAEFRVRCVDGTTWRWIRSRGKVNARDERGHAVRASGTNADITSRKRAERSLAESEARFRALTELSSDMYWEQDEHFHLVTWSAPAWTRGRDSILTRPALDAPELTEADWGAHRGILEERRPFRDLEIRQMTPDGRETWLSVGAVPVSDEQGRFRGYRGLARIITDRKLAEQRLRKSELQLRQLVEFMPAAIVFVNRDQRAVIHNKAYAELVGLPAYEISGRLIRDILGKERYAEVEPRLAQALAGKPTHYSTKRPGAGGVRIVDLDVLLWPLRGGDSEVEGVIVLGIDVTRLKEADRMKDHFVSVVSHELRTPLTAMRGSLGLLAGGVVGDLPDEARSLVDIALQNSDRLWRLVNDLLDIEKMSAGHVAFRVEPLDWRATLREAVDASRGLMQQFDVSFDLEPVEDLRVLGDSDRLSQVLANLILNAAKFSPAGGVVSVGARRQAGSVRTQVRDHGQGIPENFRSRVFQPFSQAETGDSRSTGGSGLGLAISREIVIRLGGAIGFDDAPGGGTIFWFDLPEAPVAR